MVIRVGRGTGTSQGVLGLAGRRSAWSRRIHCVGSRRRREHGSVRGLPRGAAKLPGLLNPLAAPKSVPAEIGFGSFFRRTETGTQRDSSLRLRPAAPIRGRSGPARHHPTDRGPPIPRDIVGRDGRAGREHPDGPGGPGSRHRRDRSRSGSERMTPAPTARPASPVIRLPSRSRGTFIWRCGLPSNGHSARNCATQFAI